MTNRFLSPLLIVSAAGVIGCDLREQVTQPSPLRPPPIVSAPGEDRFASVRVTPAIGPLVEGDTVRVNAVPVDIGGSELLVPYTLAYSSDAPSIASVSESGLVTAHAPGTAAISAAILIGRTTKTTGIKTHVFPLLPPGSIVLTSIDKGWEPREVELAPGGTVQWRISSIDWAGSAVNQIYLLDSDYMIVGTVELKGGSATRRFESRGVYRYCSGACWDPPDFGVIYVR